MYTKMDKQQILEVFAKRGWEINEETTEYFIIKCREDLANMYRGRDLHKFTMEWEFPGGQEIGYYTYSKFYERPSNMKSYKGGPSST